MRVTEYVLILGERARKRHLHEADRGRVIRFVVQLEVKLHGEWVPVVRYDTAHGKPHVDLYETPTRKTKRPIQLPVAEAMTFAQEDISKNWSRYCDQFLRRNAR